MSSAEFRTDRLRLLGRTVIGRSLWALFIAVLAVVFLYPVLMIIIGAFRDGLPGSGAPFTLNGAIEAFTSAETWQTLGYSIVLVLVCGSVATTLGGFFAWVSASTNVPGRRLLTPLMIVNLFVPPLFYTFGWIMLANPQNGLINQLARNAFGIDVLFDVQSWAGMFLLISLGYTPFAYLLMQGAFLNRDQALDEAAAISGASTLRSFFTVTLPSVGPALLGAATLIMVLVLQAFESPQLLGRPAGIYVFSTRIYHYIRDVAPAKYPAAFSLSILLIVLVIALFALQKWVLRGRSFTTLTGKSARRDPQQIGPIRWVFTAVIALFLLLNLVLPLGAVILGSLQPIFGVMSTGFSFDNYARVLQDPDLSSSLWLTAQISVLGGFAAMAIALLTSYITLRRSGFLRVYTSLSIWVSWALPGVVLALAFLFATLSLPGASGLYGTSTLMVIVLVVATIPICGRLAEGALAQLAPELEEAGKISGAGPLRVLVTIVLRLLIPSFLSGWFLAGLFISGNLPIPMLLAPPGYQPVAVKALQLYLLGEMSTAAAMFMVILAAAVVVLALAGLSMAIGRWYHARTLRLTAVTTGS